MKPNVFMSYSRREVSFVNNLVDDLEDLDFNVWLDYRSLIPGTTWADQIDRGIAESEVILIVVSKASMASEYVEMEWKEVLKQGKRVILLIFEAVDLPEELECVEWVDFRGSYKKAMVELVRQLEQSEEEEHPAPETGFKVPRIVWAAVILSSVIALLSLGAFWTIFVPWLLIPLPFRVLRRNFKFTQVQSMLVMLPFALVMTGFFSSEEDFELLFYLAFGSIPFVISLILVLRSGGMQRWGKPMATRPIFANPYKPNNPNPKPISFFVDHAPEDRSAATELTKKLQQYGHPLADEIAQAEAVFVLVSDYNKYTEADPQCQVVYPVMIQTTNDIHEKLTKVQWIDFRGGIRNLDALAQLLPDPAKLLKALGIRPMGNQQILPPIIQYLTYFITALAIITVGSWLPALFQFSPEIAEDASADGSLFWLLVNLVLFCGLAWWMARSIVRRKGRLASARNAFLGMLGLGILVFGQLVISGSIMDGLQIAEEDFRGLSSFFPILLYILGNGMMILFVYLKRADLRHWFPTRSRK